MSKVVLFWLNVYNFYTTLKTKRNFLIIMSILQEYLKSKRVQKALNTKPGEEGFSLVELVVVIAVLAILSAVAIPAFVGVQANARASAVQNGLVNGIKECVVRAADRKSTLFADAQSFSNANAFQGYTVSVTSTVVNGVAVPSTSCHSALATADADTDADFEIAMNPSTGEVSKTCSDENAPGCTSETDADGNFTW